METIIKDLGGNVWDIEPNSNLNDYTGQGKIYNSRAGYITTSLSNRPSGLNSSFILFAPMPTIQIIITTWAEFYEYKRTYDGGWGNWYKVTGTAVEYAT